MTKWIGVVMGSSRAVQGCAVVMILSGWVLWHDIGVYRATVLTRLVGPTYAVTPYDTEARCQAARQTAMAREEMSRGGRMTERLSDGIKVWESDREYYTMFRYRCAPAGVAVAPFD